MKSAQKDDDSKDLDKEIVNYLVKIPGKLT